MKGFLDKTLVPLGRSERRRWGGTYIRGLLATGGHKATASMAARMPDGNVQAMQQFIGQSPWPWEPVRQGLAHQMVEALHPMAAWVVDDTGFPKKGSHSVGVARQYSGTLGKIGNCQVAVSLHYATDDGAAPLDFALYLPEEWLEEKRRRAAGIPAEVTFQTKWALALALIDRALAWEVPRGVVSADAAYGNTTEFRTGLAERKLLFVVGIQNTTTVWTEPVKLVAPSRGRRGRPRTKPLVAGAPISVAGVSQSWPKERWQYVTWREGTKGPMTSRFAATRVLPSHSYQHGGPKEEVLWLLAEWPEEEGAPTKFWLANLPEDASLLTLVRLAKIRWWIEQGYQQLKDELGLDHYEGRTWQGWHHHVTMTMLAFGFLILERLHIKKNFRTGLVPAEGAA
ncbi:MAG: IS701 family transposase [Chloroflexi bacterium]|nr:IS701 family transposase [Chloroflexota bacterium]